MELITKQNLFFLTVTASTCVTPLPYEANITEVAQHADYNAERLADISKWNDNGFKTYDYDAFSKHDKSETIVTFAQKLISNTKDIDPDIIDIVDDNFWDLI